MKRTMLIEIISSLLLCFYFFTAINSFFQLQSLKNLLAFYTLHTSAVAWTLVIAETCVAALLFFRKTRATGFIAALAMLVYAGWMIKTYPRFPHDFGGLFNFLKTKQELYLITLLSSLCIIALALILVRRKPEEKVAFIKHNLPEHLFI
jgi:hypothetical protein